MPVKSFDLATLESLSKILGDTTQGLTGSEISKFLAEYNIEDPDLSNLGQVRIKLLD